MKDFSFIALATLIVTVPGALALWLTTVCADYWTNHLLHKDAPWYIDLVIGLLLNGFNVILAIVAFLLG